MVSELEPDLQNTVDWGTKGLVDFNVGKTELNSFDWSNSSGVVGMKINMSVLEEKLPFKMLGLSLSSKLNWGSNFVSFPKTEKKVGT